MTLESFNHEETISLVPVALEDGDMAGLARIIGTFLAAMRKRIPMTDAQKQETQAAFDRLERLRNRLLQEGKVTLLMEDILALDAALILFSLFLLLECPKSERRETAIDGFWKIREQLSVLRRSSPPGLN